MSAKLRERGIDPVDWSEEADPNEGRWWLDHAGRPKKRAAKRYGGYHRPPPPTPSPTAASAGDKPPPLPPKKAWGAEFASGEADEAKARLLSRMIPIERAVALRGYGSIEERHAVLTAMRPSIRMATMACLTPEERAANQACGARKAAPSAAGAGQPALEVTSSREEEEAADREVAATAAATQGETAEEAPAPAVEAGSAAGLGEAKAKKSTKESASGGGSGCNTKLVFPKPVGIKVKIDSPWEPGNAAKERRERNTRKYNGHQRPSFFTMQPKLPPSRLGDFVPMDLKGDRPDLRKYPLTGNGRGRAIVPTIKL